MAGREIDDAEPPHSERDTVSDPRTFVVRAAMADHVAHATHERAALLVGERRAGARRLDETGDSAHSKISAVSANPAVAFPRRRSPVSRNRLFMPADDEPRALGGAGDPRIGAEVHMHGWHGARQDELDAAAAWRPHERSIDQSHPRDRPIASDAAEQRSRIG